MAYYSSILLDHAAAPRNAGPLDSPDVIGRSSLAGKAPFIAFHVRIDCDHVTSAGFQTNGCGVAIAACSALTELVRGKSLAGCRRLRSTDVAVALDGIPPEKEFCARLAVEALQDALGQLDARHPMKHRA